MREARRDTLRPLVGDLRQVASVRRIVLDDGPERGVRALVFSTGGGLDFWVMADRSLDIGTLSWRGAQLGWQGPAGFASPALAHADADGGLGFGRGFSGFLITCGLDHIRQPAGGLPQHGHLPHTPARVTRYGEDWSETPMLYCEGEVVQWRYGGETFLLRRRIEAPIGGNTLRIIDTVENIGPETCPLYILYHFNLGFPAIASGATIQLDGRRMLGPLAMPAPGTPERAECHPSGQQQTGVCLVETPGDAAPGLRMAIKYGTASLPFLQLWRDLRPNCGVVSIEPCNCDRSADGGNGSAPVLAPGQSASFHLEIDVGDLPSP